MGKMTDKQAELLPCPCCGGEAAFGDLEIGKHFFVHCVECLAATNHLVPHGNTKEIAAKLWNTRQALTAPQVDKALRHLRAHAEWQPLDNWHEDDGPAFWTKFPVCEPYYAGSPLDTKWPGYHTHFIPMSVFDRLIDKDGNLIQQNTPGTSDAAPVAVRTQAGAPAEPADAQERGDECACRKCRQGLTDECLKNGYDG